MQTRKPDRARNVISSLLPEASVQDTLDEPAKLSARLRYFHTPGISIAVINNFEVEWSRGYGLADAKTGARVTASTCFQAGSISKLVTLLAATSPTTACRLK